MIQFITPQLSDRERVDSYFLPSGYRCCEYAFTNIFAWRDAFQEQIGEYAGYLTVRCNGSRYFWPAGQGDIRPMLKALEQDAASQGNRLSLYSLTEGEKRAWRTFSRENLSTLWSGTALTTATISTGWRT